MPDHILIVDDDPLIRNRLGAYLGKEGFRVSTAGDGAEMRRVLDDDPAQLVILDLVMPGEDGLSLTRFLREHSAAGIIILTGKGEPLDRVIGLEIGADDYVAKPFDLRELLARIRSVLRRAGSTQPATTPTNLARFAAWTLDLERRELTAPSGEGVHLTTAEFQLLATFVGSPNRVLDRDRLLDAAAHRCWDPYDRSIDIHISNLRRKIEDDPKRPSLIKTVRGAGYVLACPVERL